MTLFILIMCLFMIQCCTDYQYNCIVYTVLYTLFVNHFNRLISLHTQLNIDNFINRKNFNAINLVFVLKFCEYDV